MVQHVNVPAFKKQWVLDAQWTDCPPEIEEIVKALWRQLEFGNDHFMFRTSARDLADWDLENETFEPAPELGEHRHKWVKRPMDITPLVEYIKQAGIPEDEQIIIHWWW